MMMIKPDKIIQEVGACSDNQSKNNMLNEKRKIMGSLIARTNIAYGNAFCMEKYRNKSGIYEMRKS